MEKYILTETEIVELIVNFLCNKKDGNWHRETLKIPSLHQHGADIEISGGKSNGEKFIIECKKKSYAKSAYSANHECWLNALGQLISRMSTARSITKGKYKGDINRAYKYGLGLYWESEKYLCSEFHIMSLKH